MAKVPSRVLVIDSSIARAAGDTSNHPTARNCCDFLQAVLDVCHRIALTDPLRDEWNKHQSRFARTWRVSMMANIHFVAFSSHHHSFGSGFLSGQIRSSVSPSYSSPFFIT